jgi:hypothetical protein
LLSFDGEWPITAAQTNDGNCAHAPAAAKALLMVGRAPKSLIDTGQKFRDAGRREPIPPRHAEADGCAAAVG